MAIVASEGIPGPSDRDEILLQPVSYAVRHLMIRPAFDRVVSNYLFDTAEPTEDQIEQAQTIINDITGHWQGPVDQAEKGLAKAMRFALFPAERKTDLMRRFADHILQEETGLIYAHVDQFAKLVESFHGKNESADALRRIALAKR